MNVFGSEVLREEMSTSHFLATEPCIETLEDGTGLRELGVVRDVRVAVKLVSDEAGEQYIGCGGIEVWGYPV